MEQLLNDFQYSEIQIKILNKVLRINLQHIVESHKTVE